MHMLHCMATVTMHTGWRIVRPTEFVSVVEAMNAGHAMQGWANALVIDKAGGMQAYGGVAEIDVCIVSPCCTVDERWCKAL
jgi:hypothetical protein